MWIFGNIVEKKNLPKSILALNSIPNDKILGWSKFKTLIFAKDKIDITENLKIALERVEYIVGKGENAGLPSFSPFPTMFCICC